MRLKADRGRDKAERLALLRQVLPDDAVFMGRDPWETLVHIDGNQRGVGYPYAEPEVVLAIARHYKVTHLIVKGRRPLMERYVKNNRDQFETVRRSPFVVRILYDKIPDEMFADLSTVKPLWDPREADL